MHYWFKIFIGLLCLGVFSTIPYYTFCQTLYLDSSFGNNGSSVPFKSTNSVANSIAVQPDQKIVLAGTRLVRQHPSGSLDSSFNSTGVVAPPFLLQSVALQTDGKIVVAGVKQDSIFSLSRYTITGSIDSTFGTNGVVETSFIYKSKAYAVAIQSDGKIVAAGSTAYTLGSSTNVAIARYNTDGILDSSYGINGKVVTPVLNSNNIQQSVYAASVAIHADNKLCVAVKDSYVFRCARYKTDGTLDSSFGTAGMVNFNITSNLICWASAITLQQDGKVVLAGTTTTNGSRWPKFAVARLNTNGNLDASFNQSGKVYNGIYFDDYATSVAMQPDGKIVAAGYGLSAAPTRLLVAQYNTNGTVAATKAVVPPNVSWSGALGYAVATTHSRIYVTGFSDQLQPPNNNSSLHVITTVAFLNTAIPLPLQLVKFTAAVSGSTAICSWETENEINTSHFNVQRSRDGQNYLSIAKVEAKGNSPSAVYNYADALVDQLCKSCLLYYRLQMVDKDGKYTYSKVTTVKWQQNAFATIFPNPTTHALFIKNNKAELVDIFNLAGLLVLQQKINSPVIQINLKSFPKGNYIVKLSDSHGNVQVEKLLIE